MPTVRAAAAEELSKVGVVLAAAFADDPVWSWMAAPGHWDRRAPAWFERDAMLTLAGHGEVLVDDELRGAAVWAAPKHWKGTGGEAVRLALPSVRLFRRRMPRAMRAIAAMESHHPVDPAHWYLSILGTDPAHQGHGVGSALIRAVTDRCDAEGLPAYLESSKEANVPFYARHGFQVTEELTIDDGPTMWLMWRDPES